LIVFALFGGVWEATGWFHLVLVGVGKKRGQNVESGL